MLKKAATVVFIVVLGWILLALPSPEEEGEPAKQEKVKEKPLYRPGIFRGRGEGFVSDIIIEVEIESLEKEPYFHIRNITVVESEDIEKYFQPAKEKIISKVLDEQRVDVDVETRATYSRRGLKEAIKNALDEARRGN